MGDSETSGNSRPVSPGDVLPQSKGGKSGRAEKKGKKGVTVQNVEPSSTSGATDMPQTLGEALEELARKTKRIDALEAEVAVAHDKQAEVTRSSAKRLVQIAALEDALEREKAKSAAATEELEKQRGMMELVMNFRDQECARDVNELMHENMELKAKMETWRERAQTLQQERWKFVRKFQAAKLQLIESGVKGNVMANGTGGDGDDDDDDDDDGSEEGDKKLDSDDDW